MFATTSDRIQFGCVFTTLLLWIVSLGPLYYGRTRRRFANGFAATTASLEGVTVPSDGQEAPSGYDHSTPRLPRHLSTMFGHRAQGAHLNTFEAFTMFALAVYFNWFGAGSHTGANALCIIFVVCRAFYLVTYWGGQATLRTIFWSVGFLATLILFILPFGTNY
ncbi:hypothetical protein H4R33_002280 [Dimargaris cristalligena]|uniref:MAPEG family-domain-containing protein n=1 Tax=Dimargaris cristalligena TaxID=215637 RepID=A0A4V1J5V4_9FUNG|nr:hypothetical protein H4R33_002280 [Dimargaris cristalligena]RKP40369.1 hypothetical protein BJ085DRAFT_37662 [Dimargaris cristalligena]|eukprot:RKP40369.1 hypothetical protein BJ085DRAFT_37662 [Dimargaris cristalligena]